MKSLNQAEAMYITVKHTFIEINMSFVNVTSRLSCKRETGGEVGLLCHGENEGWSESAALQ